MPNLESELKNEFSQWKNRKWRLFYLIDTLFNQKKSVYIHKPCFQFFAKNHIITASRIPFIHEVTMDGRLNMIGPSMKPWKTRYPCKAFPSWTTQSCLLLRNDKISPNNWPETPQDLIF